jgi:hypothetical protein
LKPFIATGEEPSTQPVQPNIYELPLAIRHQVRGLELATAEKQWASDLQKHWRDSAPAAAGAKQSAAAAMLSDALRRGPRLSREGILRDC